MSSLHLAVSALLVLTTLCTADEKQTTFTVKPGILHRSPYSQPDITCPQNRCSYMRCAYACAESEKCVLFSHSHKEGACVLSERSERDWTDYDTPNAVWDTYENECPVSMGYQYKTLFQSRLCLRFVSLKLNHSDADDYCKAAGARLVRAKTQDIINVVTEGQGDFVWVGADDIAVEAEHHWNDGTPLLLNDTLWGTDEGVRSDEECVAVNPSKELADLQCSREHPFVCQIQM